MEFLRKTLRDTVNFVFYAGVSSILLLSVIFTRIVCSLKTNVKNVGIEANTLLIILKKTVVASVKSIVIIGILKIKTQTK